MGGSLQEIFQRRDGKKGYGIRLKRTLLPTFLFLSYIGIIFNLPATKSLLWFCFTLLPVSVYSYLCFIKHARRYTLETLSSFALLIAGGIEFLNHAWLHFVYFPFLILLSLLYGPGTIVPLGIAVPLLEIRHFIHGDIAEEAFVSIITILSGIPVSVVLSRTRRERDRLKRSIESLKEDAEDIDLSTPVDVLGGESFVSRHLSSTNKANEEIEEILRIVKHLIAADYVNMYVFKENTLHLRRSSEGTQSGEIADRESLTACIQKKKPVVSGSDAGDNALSSNVATPIMDGNFVAGVMTACKEDGTFKDDDVKICEMFSGQMMRILQRQRIYSQLLKEHMMLKKLKDGGSRLVTSLKIDDIARSLIDAVYSIAPRERVSIALFLSRPEGFELIRQIGFTLAGGSIFDLKNTRMGLAGKSREPDYISDLRREQNPVFPFKFDGGGSVFILPLSYEKELLGILLFLSPKVNALRPYEIELLRVLGGQASSSLANARFHLEIERMATTDGLTGLFNHRNFQEKLSGEFRRLVRFPEPLSLLLIDIDFFKKVNDTYGHPAGDEVLRGVSDIIRKTIRNIDVPARYGGEEFAALLPGTNHNGAMSMAERLRKSVGESIFSLDGKALRVTVSVGAATSPYDAATKEELIEKADRALYYAKRNGRNRCVLWNEIK